jgi:hypothetical protein
MHVPPIWQSLFRTTFRLLLLAGGIVAFKAALGWIFGQINGLNMISGDQSATGILVILLVAYALLITIPFMPGIEIGIALLLLEGASIAPYVYLATMSGLFLAFLIGKWVPLKLLHNTFRDLRMRRACEMIAEIERTPKDERLLRLQTKLPKPLALIAVRYRYLLIGALVNVPGTFAIGGGGGILMLAGVLRLFHWSGIILTLAIATLPVPLAVYIMGADFLSSAPH